MRCFFGVAKRHCVSIVDNIEEIDRIIIYKKSKTVRK